MGVEVFHSLKKVLAGRGLSTSVGDEGGFAPNLASNEDAIKVILESIEKAGYTPGEDVAIALDPAATRVLRHRQGVYVSPARTARSRRRRWPPTTPTCASAIPS